MHSPEQQLEVQIIEKLEARLAHRWSIRALAGHHAQSLHRKADLGLTA